jgi:hypothetical protein
LDTGNASQPDDIEIGASAATLTLGSLCTLDATGQTEIYLAYAGDAVVNQGTMIATGAGTILGVASPAYGTFTNQGSIVATASANINLGAIPTLTNLAGTTLSGGSYEADAGSTLQLVNNAVVTTDAAKIILSGAGSVIESENTGTSQEVTIDQTLANIASTGTLELLAERNFSAAGAFTDSGLLQLGGGTFAASSGLSVASTGALGGFGTVTGAVADAGSVAASGGTLVLAGGASGSGTLSAASNAVLDLLGGAALTEALTGAGTLQLDSGTYTLGGNTVGMAAVNIDAGATLSGFGTIAGTINDEGTLNVTGALVGGTISMGNGGVFTSPTGTLSGVNLQGPLTLNGGGLTLTGTDNFAGAGGVGGGAISLTGSYSYLDLAGSLAGATTINLTGYESELIVADGAQLGTVTVNVTGEAARLFLSDSQTLNHGTLNIGNGAGYADLAFIEDDTGNGASITLGSQFTTNLAAPYAGFELENANDVLVNAGTITAASSGYVYLGENPSEGTLVNSGTILVSNGTTLVLDTAAATSSGTISVSGTDSMLLLGGNFGAASLLPSVSDNGGTVEIAGTLTNTGTLSIGNGTALGALTLSEGTISGGTISDGGNGLVSTYGTLSGVTYEGALTLGGTYSVLSLVGTDDFTGAQGSGAGAINVTSLDGGLNVYGTLSGAPTINITGSSSGLDLYGTLSSATTIALGNEAYCSALAGSQPGNATIEGTGGYAEVNLYDTRTLASGNLSVGNNGTINLGLFDDTGHGATLTLGSLYAVSVLGTSTLDADTYYANESIINQGTISATGDSIVDVQQYYAGDGFSNNGLISIGAGSEFLFYGTSFINAGTIMLGTNATANVGCPIGGAGTIDLASTTATFILTGGGALTQMTSGAGTLELGNEGTYTLAGGTLGNVLIAYGSTLSGNGTLAGSLVSNYGGTLGVSSGTLLVDGALSFESGTLCIAADATLNAAGGGTLSGAFIGGGGVLSVAQGTALGGYGTIAVSVVDAGVLNANDGDLALTGSVSGNGTLSASASATLDLQGGGALAQTVTGQGTLQLDGGTYTLGGGTLGIETVLLDSGATLSGTGTISGALINYGNVTVSGGTLAVAGGLGGSGTFSAAGGAALDLVGGSSLNGVISGAGTLTLDDGTYTLGGAISIAQVDVDAGATLSGSGTLTSGVSNAGTIDITSYYTTLVMAGGYSGTGALEVADYGSVLDLSGGGTLGGPISGAGGALRLDTGSYTLASAACSISGIEVDAGADLVTTGTLSSSVSDAGTITVSTGTLTFATGLYGSGGLVAEAGAVLAVGPGASLTETISGAGTLALTGFASLAGVTLGIADVAIGSQGTLSGYGTIAGTVNDAGTLIATGGTLALLGDVVVSGTLEAGYQGTIAGGTISMAAGAVFSGDGGTLSGVTFQGPLNLTQEYSNLSLAGSNDFTGADGSGPGTINLGTYCSLTMADGAQFGAVTINAAPGGTVLFDDTQTLASGTLNLAAGGPYNSYVDVFDDTGHGATLTLGSLYTLNFTGSANPGVTTNVAFYNSNDALINYGTITAGSSGSFGIDGYGNGDAFVNQGSIAVSNASTLNVYGVSFNSAGDISVGGSNSVLAISGSLVLTAGTLAFAGGTLSAYGVTIGADTLVSGYGTISATASDAGSIEASGGTLLLSGGISGDGALLADSGAVLDISGGGGLTGIVSGAGTLQLDGGTYTLARSGLAVANVAVDSGADLLGSGTVAGGVADAGTVEASGGTLVLSGGVSGAGALIADASGVLDLIAGGSLTEAITGDGTLQLDGGTYTLAGAELAVDNVEIDAEADLFGSGVVDGTVVVAGTVEAAGGTLVLSGGVSGTGALIADAGAVLDLVGGGGLVQAISGAGTLQLDSGTYTVAGGELAVASLLIDAGADLFGNGTVDGAVIDAGTVEASGGTLVLSGGISGAGALIADASDVLDLVGGGSLTEAISGAGTLQLDSGTYTLAGAELAVANVAVDTGASLFGAGTVDGAVADAGTVEAFGGILALLDGVSGAGALIADAGAVLDLAGGGDLTEAITGAGTLQLDGGTYTIAAAALAVANIVVDTGATLFGNGTILDAVVDAGTVETSGGTLILSGGVSGTGALTADAGAVLDLVGGGSLTEAITGAGTLQLDGGTYSLIAATIATADVAVDAGAVLRGSGTVSGVVADAGAIVAAGGTLTLAGAVTGDGTLDALAGAVLCLAAGGALARSTAPSQTPARSSPAAARCCWRKLFLARARCRRWRMPPWI